MTEVIDLRAFRRRTGDGLIARFGSELVDVIDISVAGVRISKPLSPLVGRNVEFHIIPCAGNAPEFYRALVVKGHVVGESEDHLRVAFSSVNRALAGVIGQFEGIRELSSRTPSRFAPARAEMG